MRPLYLTPLILRPLLAGIAAKLRPRIAGGKRLAALLAGIGLNGAHRPQLRAWGHGICLVVKKSRW